jgi:hypothetical protein
MKQQGLAYVVTMFCRLQGGCTKIPILALAPSGSLYYNASDTRFQYGPSDDH